MESSVVVLIGMAALALAGGTTLVIYRWWRENRVHQVKVWVNEYLRGRYGESPNPLRINCSYDPLWPVLVAFNSPKTGVRHSLQFSCPGPHSTFTLVSETESTCFAKDELYNKL